MAKSAKQRAYICKVENLNARTSSSKEYYSLYVEDGKSYLFTATDLKKAEARAKKNTEDVQPVSFEEPKPIVREVIKEVPPRSILGKIFGSMFK